MPVSVSVPSAGEIDALIMTGVRMANCVVIASGVVGDVGAVEARKKDEDEDDCSDYDCGDCAGVERVGVPPADDQGWDWRCDEERRQGRG